MYKDVHIKMDLSIYMRHMFNWPLWCVPYMECKPYSMIAKYHTRGPDYILAHCACEVIWPLPFPCHGSTLLDYNSAKVKHDLSYSYLAILQLYHRSPLLYQDQPYSTMNQPYAMRDSVIYVLYWWFCHTMPDPAKVYNCLGPMYVF